MRQFLARLDSLGAEGVTGLSEDASVRTLHLGKETDLIRIGALSDADSVWSFGVRILSIREGPSAYSSEKAALAAW